MSADDPRSRPPDPAGTQPKVDPSSLVPARHDALIAPEAAGEAGEERLLPERLAHARVPGAVAAPPDPPHARRFHALIGALAGLALACVAAFVVVMAAGGDSSEDDRRPWSAWRPPGNSLELASDQIARHVGPHYHRTASDQLALVSGGPPTIAGAGLDGAALPLDLVLRNAENGSYTQARGSSVLYRLCGLGDNCAIAGTASAARWLLVRREALELALYSFRYIDGLDHVLVMLPPTMPAGSTTDSMPTDATAAEPSSNALYFRRADLDEQLHRPLAATLPGKAPLPNRVQASRGAKAVDKATSSHLFTYGLQPSNSDNSAYLILEQA